MKSYYSIDFNNTHEDKEPTYLQIEKDIKKEHGKTENIFTIDMSPDEIVNTISQGIRKIIEDRLKTL